jgi:hypothetical protein
VQWQLLRQCSLQQRAAQALLLQHLRPILLESAMLLVGLLLGQRQQQRQQQAEMVLVGRRMRLLVVLRQIQTRLQHVLLLLWQLVTRAQGCCT